MSRIRFLHSDRGRYIYGLNACYNFESLNFNSSLGAVCCFALLTSTLHTLVVNLVKVVDFLSLRFTLILTLHYS